VVRLRDTTGLHHLAELVRHAGREVHVLDLIAATDGVAPRRVSAAQATESGLHDASRVTGDGADGPDEQARAAYQERISELEDDIVAAEAVGELDRAGSLRVEQEAVAGELGRSLGLGVRRLVPEVERARVAVTNALRRTVRRMSAPAPQLAAHFDRALRTGQFCVYDPDATDHVAWHT
jgi:hypothetical protein